MIKNRRERYKVRDDVVLMAGLAEASLCKKLASQARDFMSVLLRLRRTAKHGRIGSSPSKVSKPNEKEVSQNSYLFRGADGRT